MPKDTSHRTRKGLIDEKNGIKNLMILSLFMTTYAWEKMLDFIVTENVTNKL